VCTHFPSRYTRAYLHTGTQSVLAATEARAEEEQGEWGDDEGVTGGEAGAVARGLLGDGGCQTGVYILIAHTWVRFALIFFGALFRLLVMFAFGRYVGTMCDVHYVLCTV
jgi:hypothetical protein